MDDEKPLKYRGSLYLFVHHSFPGRNRATVAVTYEAVGEPPESVLKFTVDLNKGNTLHTARFLEELVEIVCSERIRYPNETNVLPMSLGWAFRKDVIW